MCLQENLLRFAGNNTISVDNPLITFLIVAENMEIEYDDMVMNMFA